MNNCIACTGVPTLQFKQPYTYQKCSFDVLMYYGLLLFTFPELILTWIDFNSIIFQGTLYHPEIFLPFDSLDPGILAGSGCTHIVPVHPDRNVQRLAQGCMCMIHYNHMSLAQSTPAHCPGSHSPSCHTHRRDQRSLSSSYIHHRSMSHVHCIAGWYFPP